MFYAQVVKTQREHVHMHVNAPGDATVHMKHFLAPGLGGVLQSAAGGENPLFAFCFQESAFLRLRSQSQNQSGGISEFRNPFTASLQEWESTPPYIFSDAQAV